MKALHIIAFILLVIGGLNWLFVAFGWNLVTMLFGTWPTVVMVIYILVGLSAIYEAVMHGKNCKACSAGGSMMK
jgi:uncharacterized membrane protein YuzA (DUF378 family)